MTPGDEAEILLDLSDSEIITIAKAAHAKNITFNQFIVNAATWKAMDVIRDENDRLRGLVDNLQSEIEELKLDLAYEKNRVVELEKVKKKK